MTKNSKLDYKEPYIYFITNLHNAKKALQHYAERWQIECCFKHLKSNGFDVEAMNFKNDKKIELMMGIVVTAYVLAIKEGMVEKQRNSFSLKKYRNGKKYAEVSVFRKGLEVVEGFLEGAWDLMAYLFAVFTNAKRPTRLIKIFQNVQ